MKIWKKAASIEEINRHLPNTIHIPLGIQFINIGDDFLEAEMPVDERTRQPAGLLHGGASVVLAESLGSIASLLVVGNSQANCVGIEISASHLSSIRSGRVIGKATPIRLGKTLHVWNIEVRNAEDPTHKICQSRLTVLVR